MQMWKVSNETASAELPDSSRDEGSYAVGLRVVLPVFEDVVVNDVAWPYGQ